MPGAIGFNATLKVGTASANTLVAKAKDVEIDGSSSPAETTSRADAGWKSYLAGLREWSANVDQLWVPTDAGLIVLRDAFINGTILFVDFDDGTGKGFTSTCLVKGLKLAQPLSNGAMLPCVLQGASALAAK